MKHIKVYRHTEIVKEAESGTVMAIGNFDGIHKGHKALIEHTVKMATEKGLTSVVLTFEPHPRSIFAPNTFEGRLTPFSGKACILREMGVDVLYVLRFNKAYSATMAEDFIEETLLSTLNVKHVVVGEDFCFGKGRQGSVQMLQSFGEKRGFSVKTFKEVCEKSGERFASSLVRQALNEGDVARAHHLLGRYYSVQVSLFEDNFCNLRGNIHKYCQLKTGVYLTKISYTVPSNGEEILGVTALSVVNGQVIIPPMNDMPDIPEGRFKIEFIKLIQAA